MLGFEIGSEVDLIWRSSAAVETSVFHSQGRRKTSRLRRLGPSVAAASWCTSIHRDSPAAALPHARRSGHAPGWTEYTSDHPTETPCTSWRLRRSAGWRCASWWTGS